MTLYKASTALDQVSNKCPVQLPLLQILAYYYRTLSALLPVPSSPMELKACITRFLGSGYVGNVFGGCFEDIQTDDITCKIGETEESRALLLHEATIYQTLSSLQGSAIPEVHGLFVHSSFYVLVMKYVGKALTLFIDLKTHHQ